MGNFGGMFGMPFSNMTQSQSQGQQQSQVPNQNLGNQGQTNNFSGMGMPFMNPFMNPLFMQQMQSKESANTSSN